MAKKTASIPVPLSKGEVCLSVLLASGTYIYFLEIQTFQFSSALTIFLLSALWISVFSMLARYAAVVEKWEIELPVPSFTASAKVSFFHTVPGMFAGASVFLFLHIRNGSFGEILNMGPGAAGLFIGLLMFEYFLCRPYRRACALRKAAHSTH